MGYMKNGNWTDTGYAQLNGEFVRQDSAFRNKVTTDGGTGFQLERGRYHLYVSLACPWAHRTLIFRKLLGLEDVISVSIVEPVITPFGWAFSESLPDEENGFKYLHEAYSASDCDYTGVVSVPVLWDKKTRVIVNNESSEIIRMFNDVFRHISETESNYYPLDLASKIEAVNQFLYTNINNGVYRCGFATTQSAYTKAFQGVFDALDKVESILSESKYLLGDMISESDWRLFTTLIRFDVVYYGHFKCNLRRISDYRHLPNYVRDLYQRPGISETVNFDHIKRHYYLSHSQINPTGIVPNGPELEYLRISSRQ